MIVVGVILLLLALVVIVYMWLATAGMPPVEISYGILNLDLTPVWLFFLGGIALAVATSGLWLLGVGTKSAARRSREMRELRRQAKETERRGERDRDRAALGSDQGRRTGSSDATTRPGPGQGTSTGTTRDGSTQPGAARPDGGQQPILPRPGRDETPSGRGPAGDPAGPDR